MLSFTQQRVGRRRQTSGPPKAELANPAYLVNSFRTDPSVQAHLVGPRMRAYLCIAALCVFLNHPYLHAQVAQPVDAHGAHLHHLLRSFHKPLRIHRHTTTITSCKPCALPKYEYGHDDSTKSSRVVAGVATRRPIGGDLVATSRSRSTVFGWTRYFSRATEEVPFSCFSLDRRPCST